MDVVSLDRLDTNRVGLVDEVASDPGEELGHRV